MTAAPVDYPEVSDATGPTFLVIGAMKCATSMVCACLEDHPDVFMVPRAEPNYFSHNENWAKGWAYYAPFFRGAEDGHLNESAGKRVPSALYTRLNRFPGTALTKRFLPVELRSAVKRKVLSRPAKSGPNVATLLPGDVLDLVRENARTFPAHADRPADFWRLPSSDTVAAS